MACVRYDLPEIAQHKSPAFLLGKGRPTDMAETVTTLTAIAKREASLSAEYMGLLAA